MSRPPKIFSQGLQWAKGPTWYGWRRCAKNLEGRGRVAGSGRRAPGAALGAGAAQGAQAGTAPAGSQGLRAVIACPWRRPLEKPRDIIARRPFRPVETVHTFLVTPAQFSVQRHILCQSPSFSNRSHCLFPLLHPVVLSPGQSTRGHFQA